MKSIRNGKVTRIIAENRAKKRKLAQANTQQQQRVEKLSAAERQKQCRLRKKAENQQQASDAQANTQQQRVSRPEIEAEDDDDDYVFQVKRVPSVPIDTTSIDAEFNTLRTGSFKLFKRPLPGFLTILTL